MDEQVPAFTVGDHVSIAARRIDIPRVLPVFTKFRVECASGCVVAQVTDVPDDARVYLVRHDEVETIAAYLERELSRV